MHLFTGRDRRRFARRAERACTIFKKNARRAWGWCNTVPGRRRMKSKHLYWFSMVNRIKCELVVWDHHSMTPLERKLHKAGFI